MLKIGVILFMTLFWCIPWVKAIGPVVIFLEYNGYPVY